jgi:hypothetical protein
LRWRTTRADRNLRASRSSISVSGCRSAVSSSTADASGVPASPISARAAARRVSTRSAPSASSLILTSSPACKPTRRRNSAGRTNLNARGHPVVLSHARVHVGQAYRVPQAWAKPGRLRGESKTARRCPGQLPDVRRKHASAVQARKAKSPARRGFWSAPGEIRTPDLRFRRPRRTIRHATTIDANCLQSWHFSLLQRVKYPWLLGPSRRRVGQDWATTTRRSGRG